MQYFIFLISVFFIGCSAFEGEQKTNVYDVIKSQKIVQISKPDILQKGEQFGLLLMDSVNKTGRTIEVNCEDKMLNINTLDTLFNYYLLTVKVGFDTKVFETSTEKELLEAYQYNDVSNLSSQHSVQFLTDKTILFTYPEKMDSLQQKNCQVSDSLSLGMWSIKIPVKTILNELD